MMRASSEETKARQRQRAASSADERIMSKDLKVEMVQPNHTHTHTHTWSDAMAQTLNYVPAVSPPHPWVAANQQLSGASPLHSAARSKAENLSNVLDLHSSSFCKLIINH